MQLKAIPDSARADYNRLVTHPMQSWEWGEFRKSIGTDVERYGIYDNEKLITAFQLTFHPIPFTAYTIGYLPKGSFPDADLAQALAQIAREKRCAFIKLEPNVIQNVSDRAATAFIASPKSLFTEHNFILDLTQPEDELLKNMHPKTRYNIRVAEKNGVKIEERTDGAALEIYLKLYFETTKRQSYHGHTPEYHRAVWKTLREADMARFLIATYQDEPLTAWMLVNFHDSLYYPYGGSSEKHRNVMASNLVAWEAIKLGKKMGLKNLDMWGALGSGADPNDPWYGFHKFKQGYGGELVKYIGTYDLVFNWPIYILFTIIDKLTPLKIFLLKLLNK